MVKIMSKLAKITTFFILIVSVLHFLPISQINASAYKVTEKPEAMVTMEVSSGRVLYSKNPNERLPMASTTKILTAIVAIENSTDLDKKHKVPKEAVGIEGSSIYLRAGEELSLRELLYGLMLRSGNDAAVAIAIIVSGSIENFVKIMNEYCEKLSLQNSHFVTVNGLHDDEHYTSALDMAKITAYALKNETFAEIAKTKEKVIDNQLDKKNKCRLLKNKNKLLSMVEGADGVKTGYTTKAGKCFVGSATRDGMQVVCVVLNSKTMFEECAELLEKSFKEFKLTKLFEKGEIQNATLPIKKRQNFPIMLKNDIILPINGEELQKIYARIVIRDDLKVPISEDETIGKIEVFKEKDLIFSDKIYTINIEDEWTISDYIGKVIQIF